MHRALPLLYYIILYYILHIFYKICKLTYYRLGSVNILCRPSVSAVDVDDGNAGIENKEPGSPGPVKQFKTGKKSKQQECLCPCYALIKLLLIFKSAISRLWHWITKTLMFHEVFQGFLPPSPWHQDLLRSFSTEEVKMGIGKIEEERK